MIAIGFSWVDSVTERESQMETSTSVGIKGWKDSDTEMESQMETKTLWESSSADIMSQMSHFLQVEIYKWWNFYSSKSYVCISAI